MKVRSALAMSALVAATLLMSSLPALAGERSSAPGKRHLARAYASDRAIVGIASGGRSEVAAAIAREGGDVIAYNRTGDFFVVETSADSADWAASVEDEAAVLYSEPDWKLSADDIVPTDPSWPNLWAMRRIAAPAAWHTSTGSDDIVVGVIDSGIDYTHEDLVDQMWVNPDEDPSTPEDDDNNGWANDIHGIDCVNDDGDPADDNGHGTHIAGTIGAEAQNDKGVAGVAWKVKLMALKFLGSDGTGYTSDAIQCLYYAVDNGAHLTNNSWGGPGYSKTFQEAIRYAGSKGQLFVAAAGNGGTDITATPHYPASYDESNVLSVAASDQSDELASFSNHGATIDLAAPGTGILSTIPGGYASYSGTSMAAPHVTGAAALLLSAYPALQQDVAGLSAALLGNVDAVPSLRSRVATGGRLNVGRAIRGDGPLGMHLHNLKRSTVRTTNGYSEVTVKVSVSTDTDEQRVRAAKVVLAWSSGGRSTCTTGLDGTCSMTKKVISRAAAAVTTELVALAHDFFAHESGQDHATL